MEKKISNIPHGSSGFAIPDMVKANCTDIEKIKVTLYEEKIGVVDQVKDLYFELRFWSRIFKWVLPVLSATIIILLGIIINKLFGV